MAVRAKAATSIKKTVASTANAAEMEKPVVSDEAMKKEPVKAKTPEKIQKSVELTPNTYVTVVNGYHGKLVYVSKRTGETFIWSEFGDEQDMELQELKSAKNSCKAFFENNWFLIDDPEVVAYLGVERYYEHSLKAEDFDLLASKSADEIENIIRNIPEGQRDVLLYRVRQMMANGEIDSMRVISTIEKCLGVSLMDRETIDQ